MSELAPVLPSPTVMQLRFYLHRSPTNGYVTIRPSVCSKGSRERRSDIREKPGGEGGVGGSSRVEVVSRGRWSCPTEVRILMLEVLG